MNAPNVLNLEKSAKIWPTERLSNLAEHRLGKMLDKVKNTGNPRRYLRNPNIRWFDCDLSDLQEILVEDKDLKKYELLPGDVLICEGGEAGRAAIWKGEERDVIFQKACHRVRVGPRLDARFLVHRLYYDYHNGGLDDYYTGATIKHFTGQDLARYEFPLPPLDEQRRIAAILDKADTLRRKRKRALNLMDDLIKTNIIKLLTSSHDKKYMKIGEFADVKGGKRLPKGHNYIDEYSEYKYLRVTDIQDPNIAREKLKCISESTQRLISRYTVRDGDVVISIAGTIGVVRHINHQLDGVNLTENAAKIVTHANSRVNPIYLSNVMQLAEVNNQIKSATGQVTIGKLPLYKIEQLNIPIISTGEQIKFQSYSQKVDTMKIVCQAQIKFINKMFESIQNYAFSGKI